MNVLAVRDAVPRAAELCREGKGPVLLDVDCYRYWGHSLSDPRNEYRTKEEEAAWKAMDADRDLQEGAARRRRARSPRASPRWRSGSPTATRAPPSAPPPPPIRDAKDVLTFMYTDTKCETVPAEFAKVDLSAPLPEIKRVNGEMTYKDAIKEALVEEMVRDNRVMFYGEDVADYGGAFKVTKGLLEAFGRDRVFNTPISEACICGTACGAAMNGPAARRRADVLRLRADVVGPDQQPGRQVALHERRADRGAAGHPRLGRRRQGLRRPALADAGIDVLPHPGPVRGLSVDARRRQGHAQGGHPRQQPGHVRRIAGALWHERARCRRANTSFRSAWPT